MSYTKLPKNDPFYVDPIALDLFNYFKQTDVIKSDDELLRSFNSLDSTEILGLFYGGSKMGRTRLIEFMLEHNVVDSFSGSPPGTHYQYHWQAFTWAIIHGHLQIVKLFLASGKVDPARNNQEALKWAITHRHPQIAGTIRTAITPPPNP